MLQSNQCLDHALGSLRWRVLRPVVFDYSTQILKVCFIENNSYYIIMSTYTNTYTYIYIHKCVSRNGYIMHLLDFLKG